MNAEQYVPAQYFHIPILEVEGVMMSHGCGVGWGFVVGGVRNGEIGETGDAYGRRLGEGSYGDCVCFWNGDWIKWRWLGPRDLRFEILTRKSQGCDNWSRSGIFLIFWFQLPDCECRWGREALPAAIP